MRSNRNVNRLGQTCHPAPHGWSEECIFALHIKVVHSVFLKGSSEVLGLSFDKVFAGIEVLGDAGEEAPRGGTGGQVVDLDGKLDVQDLGVGAQHIPRHVNFHKYELLVYYLQNTGGFALITRDRRRNYFQELPLTDGVASNSMPIFIRLASKYSRRLWRYRI